jgi:putative FmdB family regulatory protein
MSVHCKDNKMPTYGYSCQKCGHNWEEFQSITEKPIKKCPKCHKNKAQRQIGVPTFILKGGGWAADGYSKP